jgi:DNA-binding transcriptional ArsR family regulator
MKSIENYKLPARVLRALAHPVRLRLLNALRENEECVCHLTALLRQRQAYVSQQLMFLRRAGLIEDRKEGLRVYYRVKDLRVFDALDAVNVLTGMDRGPAESRMLAVCPCPKCKDTREVADHKRQAHVTKNKEG